MWRSLKYRLNNVTSKLLIIILLFIIPIVATSIIANYHSRNALVDNIKSAHINMLQTYIRQVDNELDSARIYTNSLTFYNSITMSLTADTSSADFYYASNRLGNDVKDTFLFYHYISGFFLYIPKTDFYYTYLNDAETLVNKNDFKEFLAASVMPEFGTDTGWITYYFNDTRYLIQGFFRNGIYAGCYVNQDILPQLLASDESVSYLNCKELTAIQDTLAKGELLLSQQSAQSDLCAYEIIDTNALFIELPFVQKYILYISIFLVLLIPLLFIFLNRIVIYPLKILNKAMLEIQNGNLDYQIQDFHTSNEFIQVTHTFNNMIHQVNELKITVYEEKLNSQKSHLNNLQFLLRPHFMINSLNMVYNLIINKDYETALKLTSFSVNYLRYMIRVKEDFVPLNEELIHLRNYLNIQLLRYPERFSYKIEVDPFIETISVPPLFIQNFIENSLKYSINTDRQAEIILKITYIEKDFQPYVCIIIRDNGNGYPDEILNSLNNKSTESLLNKVGLSNALQRIDMLYGKQAYAHFYNDNGAVSEFHFPIL